jgi:hypothetical protein
MDPRAGSMHNHGSMGQHDAQPWIPGPEVCTTMDPWASMMHNLGSMGRDSMQFPRWIQGTWLEFHRVINADRASMMQSPAGRDSMQFPRWIPRDLVGVPSSDQRRPGRKYADVGKHWVNVGKRRAGTRCTTMDPWAGSMHNHGSQGTWLEFHRVIHGPGLDAVSSIDSMGAGTGWSCGPGLDAVPSMDPRGPGWSSIE